MRDAGIDWEAQRDGGNAQDRLIVALLSIAITAALTMVGVLVFVWWVAQP